MALDVVVSFEAIEIPSFIFFFFLRVEDPPMKCNYLVFFPPRSSEKIENGILV